MAFTFGGTDLGALAGFFGGPDRKRKAFDGQTDGNDSDSLSEMDPEDGLGDISCYESPSSLPPEPEWGNVEYKLKLMNPTRYRFEHLVTQMKWRLREGQGEAIYEIGVQDCGRIKGLTAQEMRGSLETLQRMADKLGATVSVLRERSVDAGEGNYRKTAEILVRKIPDDQVLIELRVAVLGNADVGKSTVLGVLTQGELDNGRGGARLFRHLHEIQSGRTSSISHEIMGFSDKGSVVNYLHCRTAEEIVASASKLITFIDLAGHRKYMRTTICGLTGYSPHYAMLVVGANTGLAGTTKEHLGLALALEVPIMVVVTKVDRTTPSVLSQTLESLESVLKSTANLLPIRISDEDDVITARANQEHENCVPIFCVSNVTGAGLDLLTKFLYVLPPRVSNKERELLEQEAVHFQVDEMWDIPDVGSVVGGLLKTGVVTEHMELALGPTENGSFVPVRIESIHRNRTVCRSVRASQSASLALSSRSNPDLLSRIRKGMVLLPLTAIAENISGSLYFQASITLIRHPEGAITQGFCTTVHIGNVCQRAKVVGIFLGNQGLRTNEKTAVLFRFCRAPEYIQRGAQVFFFSAGIEGIGEVTHLFPLLSPSSSSDEEAP
ncbi:unnamed protein product [Cyprideis torosa]|uniref:Uncharacterized protein n=1 Tax=Cyprideis torosa TaxID=163714 RepID=A0A7R8WDQ6_9CRUS|nr:unnamed protein product [Cyprideis torosa]CAG0889840.1 unnamed protein product [Cyprideis torosa]